MAANNQIVKKSIQIDAGDTLRTVKSLKQEISDLRDELLNLEKGTEEYDEVQKQLHDDVEDLNEVMGAHKDKAEALEGSYNALQNELKELKQAWKETNDEAERDTLGQKINELNSQLKEMDASIGDFHRNVGNYESAWNGLTGVMENGEKVTDDLEKGIKAFGTALGMSDKQVNALSKALKSMKDGFKIAKDIAKTREETGKLATEETKAAAQGTALATSQKATGAAAKTMAASEGTATVATNGLSMAMKGLKAAIISTGVGALIVLLGQLIGQLDEARIKLRFGRKELYQNFEDASEALVDNADNLVSKREKQIERTARELEAQGKTEAELIDKKIEGYEKLKDELRNDMEDEKDLLDDIKDEADKQKSTLDAIKAIHPVFGTIFERLYGGGARIESLNKSVSSITQSIQNYSGAIETVEEQIDDLNFDKYIQGIEEANKKLKGGTEELRKWSELLQDSNFRSAWKGLFQIDFTGASPIETLKAQMAAATALVKQFNGDTSEVERLFTELISDAEDEWRSLAEKEQQIFDERLTPAQRLENEKVMWVELANKWGMDAVNIVKYYDAKIKEENKKAEDAITAQQEAAEAERLAEIERQTQEQLQMMEDALETQEKLDELFNTRSYDYTKGFTSAGTIAGDIQQDMDDLQRLYDTQMEYLNGLLESADLTEEAYAAVEDRIRSLTVTFNNQMNGLKKEQEYQGKNFKLISDKWAANFKNLEAAAGDFADAFAAGGEKTVELYKGFALAQSLIAAFLAANEVLAAEPGEMFTKIAAALATFAVAIGNVMSIMGTNTDGSNASSMMSGGMNAAATPVIGNAQPIQYSRNITTAEEEDQMNQPIYVTVTDIEDGINGHRAQVTNSSF